MRGKLSPPPPPPLKFHPQRHAPARQGRHLMRGATAWSRASQRGRVHPTAAGPPGPRSPAGNGSPCQSDAPPAHRRWERGGGRGKGGQGKGEREKGGSTRWSRCWPRPRAALRPASLQCQVFGGGGQLLTSSACRSELFACSSTNCRTSSSRGSPGVARAESAGAAAASSRPPSPEPPSAACAAAAAPSSASSSLAPTRRAISAISVSCLARSAATCSRM